MRPDEEMVVATPELVAFSYEIAGIGSRFVAALLDLLVAAAILIGLGALAAFTAAGTDNATLAILLFVMGSFVLTYGYFWASEYAFNGQSLGKRAARLRVVGVNGEPISFAQAGIRNLIRFVDFLPAWYAAGLVCLFINGRGQRLGDLAAGTLVVRERRRVRLQDLPVTGTESRAGGAPALPPGGGPEWGPLVQDAALKRFLALYVSRRQTLDPATRARLAAQIEPHLSRLVPDVLAAHGPSAALDALAFRSLPPAGPPAAPPSGLPPPPPPGPPG